MAVLCIDDATQLQVMQVRSPQAHAEWKVRPDDAAREHDKFGRLIAQTNLTRLKGHLACARARGVPQLVAALLHLGNLSFEPSGDGDGVSLQSEANAASVDAASALLGVQTQRL
eukprot:1529118-Pleurochrysis_carterae.AAC.1